MKETAKEVWRGESSSGRLEQIEPTQIVGKNQVNGRVFERRSYRVILIAENTVAEIAAE